MPNRLDSVYDVRASGKGVLDVSRHSTTRQNRAAANMTLQPRTPLPHQPRLPPLHGIAHQCDEKSYPCLQALRFMPRGVMIGNVLWVW